MHAADDERREREAAGAGARPQQLREAQRLRILHRQAREPDHARPPLAHERDDLVVARHGRQVLVQVDELRVSCPSRFRQAESDARPWLNPICV
jgi:hypothetical protein